MTASPILLTPQPLTAEAFRPFGDVIEVRDAFELINSGTTQKFADLATIDVTTDGGRPCVSIYRAIPYKMPLTIKMLERHPLGSQLFMPLHDEPFVVVAAPRGSQLNLLSVCVFATNGRQGINYDRGVWHHPLVTLGNSHDFLVIDREGPGNNCDEFVFQGESPDYPPCLVLTCSA